MTLVDTAEGAAIIVAPTVRDVADRFNIADPETARRTYDALNSAGVLREAVGPTITQSQIDILNRLDPGMYDDAAASGMSFSAYLDDQAEPVRGAGFGTFEACLAEMNVETQHDRENGRRATTVAELRQAGPSLAHGGGIRAGAVMIPELMNRAWLMGQRFGGSWVQPHADEIRYIKRFYASSATLSQILQPDFLSQQLVTTPLRPSIVEQMVATTETLTGTDVWKMFYVDMSDVEARRLVRVPQGSTLPTVTITGSEHAGHMLAYGRRLLFTYEVEQWSLPLLQLHVSLFALQSNLDEEEAIFLKAVNGDGNSGTAGIEVNISDLDTVVAGSSTTIPGVGIVEYLSTLEEAAHYTRPTIAIARAIGKTLLRTANLGSANAPLFVGSAPIFPGQADDNESVDHPPIYARSYGITGKIVYIDGTKAIIRYVAASVPVQETNRIISQRMNEVTIWTKWGHQVWFPNSVQILDYAN